MMTQHRSLALLRFCLLLALGILLGSLSSTSLAAAPAKTAPAKASEKKVLKFGEIKQIVSRHFAATKGYRSGDLITRQSVANLFKQLELYGWKVADQNEILGQILSEGDFLAKQMRTDPGKSFMRKVSGYPGGFDRVDRISRMPQGRGNVTQMIKMPDGYEMIEAMTTTSRGRKLGQRLSNAPKGKDFNKPTGRIYTEAALTARLKKSFAQRSKAQGSSR
jgi:hypothetical protein